MENYVSISGVSNREELRKIGNICDDEDLSLAVVIGYLVSSKSIKGTNNPRQPRFSDLGDLVQESWDIGLMPAVHYYTKDNDAVLDDLQRVVRAGINPGSTLLQLNTLPLPLDITRKIKDMGFGIIFKVAVSDKQSSVGGYAVWRGDNVQDASSGEVAPLIEQVRERKEFIRYAMFDPSHGTNLDLVLDLDSLAVRFGRRVLATKDLSQIGLVYAGGINPGNIASIIKSLHSFFPRDRISIDIESGVRTKDNALDPELVRSYLVNYASALRMFPRL